MTATDLALLKRWQTRRDPEAFQELVHRHANMVFATCRRVLGNVSDAEEVAQDCFLSLADSADKPKRSLGGWLHALAASRARDRIRGDVRRREREMHYAAEHDRPPPANPTDAVEVLDDALAALPEKLREPLVVHFLEGLTHAEAAKRLGVSRPTITRRINAGLERLRTELRTRNVIIAASALTTLLAAEAASAAPASLVASLGTVALNAAPYTVAASGSGILMTGLVGVAAVSFILVAIGVSVPRILQAQNAARPTTATAPDTQPVVIAAQTEDVPINSEPARTPPTSDALTNAGTQSPPVGAVVRGVVRDLNGNLIADATVEVRGRRDAFAAVGSTNTNESGGYEIEGIPPTDALYVYASMDNPTLNSPPLEVGPVTAGETYDVNIELHQASLSGRVVDADGRPIADANVWANALPGVVHGSFHSATTDPSGRYVIPGLHAGLHEVRVRVGCDRKPYIESARVELGASEHRTDLTLVYNAAGDGWIWGTVADANGNPIPDAKVDVYDAITLKSTHAFTDEHGEFLIAVTGPGPYNVQVQHREYGNHIERNVHPGERPVDVTLESRVSVFGRVVAKATGSPIERFEVMKLVPVSDATDTLYTREWVPVTHPDGEFTLDGIPPGNYTIHVRAPGFAKTAFETHVRTYIEKNDATIPLEYARTVSGVVVDEAGEPIAGARVFAGLLPSNYRSGTSTVHDLDLTDAEGRFQIDEAPETIEMVSAAHPSYPPVSHAVGKDLNAVRIVLHEGGNIAGMVTVDGVPAPGATVYVLHNMETQPVMVARAETAGDGTFTLENVGPGPTMVHGGVVLEPTLVQRWMYRTIPVEGGGTVPAALAFATGDCALFGNVTHEGQPVSGVYVMVNHTIDRTAFDMARVETDPDGNYLFEGLPPGQYEFTVLIPGVDHSRQPLAQTILLTNGKALQLDVVN